MHPCQGMTFPKHLFNALYQSRTYTHLKNNLPENWALLVVDFSKNKEVLNQDEIKSAHWVKKQITMHPTVTYYKESDGTRKRFVLTHFSDLLQHSGHMAEFILQDVIKNLKLLYPNIKHFVVWSDGCSAQYKGKYAFSYLSKSVDIERSYFGSEHGKGESDGETGLINKAVHLAIYSRALVISEAIDLINFANCYIADEERQFQLIEKECFDNFLNKFDMKLPDSLAGTRKLHQMRGKHSVPIVQNIKAKIDRGYNLLVRPYSCFCTDCLKFNYNNCFNQSITGGNFVAKKLRIVVENDNESSYCEQMAPNISELTPENVQVICLDNLEKDDYILVKQESDKGRMMRYVAFIISIINDIIEVDFLKKIGDTKRKFTKSDNPNDKNRQIDINEIIMKLTIPKWNNRFAEFSFDIYVTA